MDDKLKNALMTHETDLEGAIYRFAGDEDLYVRCLQSFLEDNTIEELEAAIRSQSWDDAFTAAHAIKGVAGNMGFIPLFHASAETVILIRTGRTAEVPMSLRKLKDAYDAITGVIRRNCEIEGDDDL